MQNMESTAVLIWSHYLIVTHVFKNVKSFDPKNDSMKFYREKMCATWWAENSCKQISSGVTQSFYVLDCFEVG